MKKCEKKKQFIKRKQPAIVIWRGELKVSREKLTWVFSVMCLMPGSPISVDNYNILHDQMTRTNSNDQNGQDSAILSIILKGFSISLSVSLCLSLS